MTDDKDAKEKQDGGGCLAWVRTPPAALFATYFLSAWGDRMWHFAVGIYLVFFDGNQLRLAAIFGFASGGCVLLFGGLIGNWVDRNGRLKVVRLALFIQNLSVAISAASIAVLLILTEQLDEFHVGGRRLIEALVMLFAIIAQLASVAYKIALEKDWIVVVAAGDKGLLANLNAVTRAVDLGCKSLSPFLVGQVMTYGSRLIGALFIAGWNLVSVWLEYALLIRVYHLVPRLAHKEGQAALSEKETDNIEADEIPDEPDKQREPNGDAEATRLVGDHTSAQAEENGSTTSVTPHRLDKGSKQQAAAGPINTAHGSAGERVSVIRLVFGPFISLVSGWSIYVRQPVLLAGLSLSSLYMTVIGFDSITMGYIYSQGVTESILGLCCALAAITGIIGTFLYTRLRKYFGLHKTGIISFAAEVSCLILAVVSIWVPGSPFYLYTSQGEGLNCSAAATAQPPSVIISNSSIGHSSMAYGMTNFSSRFQRDLSRSLWVYRRYQSGDMTDTKGMLLGQHMEERSLWNVIADEGYTGGGDITRISRTARDLTNIANNSHLEIPYVITNDNDTFPVSPQERNCPPETPARTSVILFLTGIITSRVGLWMADLTVTQLYQEQVAESDRGTVSGVQSSLNMLLDMLKYITVILLPHIHTFGFLVCLSFSFIVLALFLFISHVLRANRMCCCQNKNNTNDTDTKERRNVIYKPQKGSVQVSV